MKSILIYYWLYCNIMKKLLIFLVIVFGTISTASAEDENVYISNVEHYSDRTVVTVSAKESSLKKYPNGFMVGVRPARHILDSFIITSRSEKQVHLSKDNPSEQVIFWCDENYAGKKACRQNDFVVNSRP